MLISKGFNTLTVLIITTTTTQHVRVDSEWSSSVNVQNGHQFISFTNQVPAELMSVLLK